MSNNPILQLLASIVGTLAIAGAAFCVITGFAYRKAGARGAWSVCLSTSAVLIIGLVAKVESVPNLDISIALALYMSAAFIGVPLASATFGIVRFGRRAVTPGLARQSAFGFAAYLIGLVVGFVLAALPDAYDMFGT